MVAASLVVGIENYIESHYRESHNRLRYAVSDAYAFDAYVRAAWGTNPAAHHHLLTDDGATAAAVELAAARLAGLGPLDLLLVYLSGHGDRGGDGCGWFCLADARPGTPSLDAAGLDRFLRPIEAATTLLFVDCCYAEAVVASSTFFNALGTSRARVFICSARADQRAWEEEALRQSVFSHLLLRALSTDSRIAPVDGQVDLEGALFPHLCEQVPLRVLAKKRGQAQEPVKGGLSGASVKLPTVTAHAMGRELSVLETVRARVRRILAIGAGSVLVGLFALDVTVYHLAVDPFGAIEVRPGPRALYNAMPFHLGALVDTGFTTADLAPAQRNVVERLIGGDTWGISTQKDANGVRRWLSQLLPLLPRPTAWETSMLTAARPPEDGTRLDPEEDPPPIETLFFLRALGEDAREITDLFHDVPYDLSIGCTDDATATLDFVVLNPPADLFARDLLWLAATAPEAPTERLDLVEDLVALAGYRMAHADWETVGAEFEAFAGAVSLIAELGERNMPVLSEDKAGQFRAVADSWCRAPALLALGLLGDDAARRHAEEAFLETVRSYDPTRQGDLLSPAQEAALRALAVLAERRTLAAETVRGVFEFITGDERGLEGVPTLVDWLATVAKHQPLPEETVEYLFSELDRQPGPYEFFPLIAFQILARSSQFLNREQVDHLFTWLEAHGEDHRRQALLRDGLAHFFFGDGFSWTEMVAFDCSKGESDAEQRNNYFYLPRASVRRIRSGRSGRFPTSGGTDNSFRGVNH